MATPVNKLYGHELQLYVANAETSVMEKYALLNGDRSFSVSGSQVEDPQIDLDDQSKPAVITRRGQNSDTAFSGGGMLHKDKLADAFDWSINQTARNCEIRFANTVTVAGQYIMSNFEVSGTREEAVDVSFSLVQAEKPTITPVVGDDD